MDAARWTNAAARIGRFETVDAALFDNQDIMDERRKPGAIHLDSLGPHGFSSAVQKVGSRAASPKLPATPAPQSTGPILRARHVHSARSSLGKQVPVNSTPTIVITYKGQRYPPMSGIFTCR